ncbi:alginate O-acetyltransferase complex protein AlgJ [Desulfovibrionales bacterium]
MAVHHDNTTPASRPLQALVVLLFLVMLVFPFLGPRLGINELSSSEKRTLAALPAWPADFKSLISWPQTFENYYNDNFGLRTNYIIGHNYLKAKLLGISPSKKVIFGRNGWMFLDASVHSWRAGTLFTSFEMELWKLKIEAKRDWLAAKKITYLFVVAPNKSTIYSEYLPQAQTRIHVQSRCEQLKAYLKTHSDVPFLDLAEPLIAAKPQKLYYLTNTHWNDTGCYVAYRAIMEALVALGVAEPPLPAEAFARGQRRVAGFDLAIMLNLRPWYFEESIFLDQKNQCAKPAPIAQIWERDWQAYALQCLPKRDNLIIVGDSFVNATKLFNFMADHFRRTIFLHQKYYPMTAANMETLVAAEHPKIFIEEVVERSLETESFMVRPF